jgi:hypothetical protein
MVFTVNSYNVLKQHYPVDRCNGEMWCSLWDTYWILKYYLDKLRLNPFHHNVFTFTLFLPEGRAGVAWEPSNKMMLFLPPRKIKSLSLHSLISALNLLFYYPLSLSSASKGYSGIRSTVWNDGAKSPQPCKILFRYQRSHLWSTVYHVTSTVKWDVHLFLSLHLRLQRRLQTASDLCGSSL